MKVFVMGGTGVVGRPLLRRLADEGHDVTAVARSAEKAALVRGLGATPVELDVFDPDAVRTALEGMDAAIHCATSIPSLRKGARTSGWAMNDRLRREGTKVLVDAALAAGVGRVVKEHVAFLYEDRGDQWIDEDTPVLDNPLFDGGYAAEREVARFTEAGGTGVAVRLGMFYGPDASSTDEALHYGRRYRIGIPVMGEGDGYHASIHTDDAASALAAALRAPAGLYNAAGTPSTKREFIDAFSESFGLKRLRLMPGWMVKLGTGGKASFFLNSQRISSQRFADATGWRPDHQDVRDGWAAAAAARKETVGA